MTELREQIARVIDPEAMTVAEIFRRREHWDPDTLLAWETRAAEIEAPLLAKADAIIALLPASQAVRDEAVDKLVKAARVLLTTWDLDEVRSGLIDLRTALAPFIAGEGE